MPDPSAWADGMRKRRIQKRSPANRAPNFCPDPNRSVARMNIWASPSEQTRRTWFSRRAKPSEGWSAKAVREDRQSSARLLLDRRGEGVLSRFAELSRLGLDRLELILGV